MTEPPEVTDVAADDLARNDLAPNDRELSDRARSWAATMGGFEGGSAALRRAHLDSGAKLGAVERFGRESREASEDALLAPGATRARAAGHRAIEEDPDPLRTCFERDR